MAGRTRTDDWPCPIARTSDLIGDQWTTLILRDALMGVRRFEDFQRDLDASRSVLSTRLQRLVDEDMLVRVPYQERPVRHEYRLTDKGRAFWDVLAAMWRWGDEWLFDDGPGPLQLIDRETGEEIRPRTIDETTGERLDLSTTRVRRRRPGDDLG